MPCYLLVAKPKLGHLDRRSQMLFQPSKKEKPMTTAFNIKFMAIIIVLSLVSGCMSASQHYQETHGAYERQMTVGIVQKEIRKGMSAAEVALALGSPNIVTTDDKGREVWVYDKISTDVTYSNSSGGGGAVLLIGGASKGAGGGGLGYGSYNQSAGARSKTQRTLTVVIKYDTQKRVRDFAYHSSRF